MFTLKRSSEKTELEVVRTRLISDLEAHEPETDQYKKIMDHLQTLTTLMDLEKPERLNPNTVAVILGNASVAALVLWFERDNVVTTKLFSFIKNAK